MVKNYTLFETQPEASQYVLVCNLCGAVVHNIQLHDEFHESFDELAIKYEKEHRDSELADEVD